MEYILEKDILIQRLESALYDALAFIEEVERDFGVVPEEDVLERITAAIAAAKGE
jgi:hypothetical protein